MEEAVSAESRKDFVHKYAIACKEARESHYWLRLLSVSEVVPKDRLAPLTSEANELIAILTTIIKSLASEFQTSSFPLQTSFVPTGSRTRIAKQNEALCLIRVPLFIH